MTQQTCSEPQLRPRLRCPPSLMGPSPPPSRGASPQVRVDLHRASDAGLLVLSGHRHTEWVTPSPAARQLRPRPYGRYVPIGRLFSGNPTQMQWLKDVFGDVSTLFHFLLTEVRVKGTLPASVPPNALPKGKLVSSPPLHSTRARSSVRPARCAHQPVPRHNPGRPSLPLVLRPSLRSTFARAATCTLTLTPPSARSSSPSAAGRPTSGCGSRRPTARSSAPRWASARGSSRPSPARTALMPPALSRAAAIERRRAGASRRWRARRTRLLRGRGGTQLQRARAPGCVGPLAHLDAFPRRFAPVLFSGGLLIHCCCSSQRACEALSSWSNVQAQSVICSRPLCCKGDAYGDGPSCSRSRSTCVDLRLVDRARRCTLSPHAARRDGAT